jgi:uncharacterized repeat protein (TIGR03803 family)
MKPVMSLRISAVAIAMCVAVALPGFARAAAGFTVLYSFCTLANCADGGAPNSLLADRHGNLFGTTVGGGTAQQGTVFAISPAGTESVLYSFCPPSPTHCETGEYPAPGLIEDSAGNFYGMTTDGGPCSGGECSSAGTAFELASDGTETTLYSFCTAPVHCTDGSDPGSGLTLDRHGNLFGVTEAGGATNRGALFRIAPGGTETVIHSFSCIIDTRRHADCPGGAFPSTRLVLDAANNLYGTTLVGGASYDAGGTVYKLAPDGSETVLYSFCSLANCADGASPSAGLLMDRAGNFYGATAGGGAAAHAGKGRGGTVFRLAPDGTQTVLYAFCSRPRCADGNDPLGSMAFDEKGNLYGTTLYGGANNDGTIFMIAPDGTQTTLYSFCSQAGCADGSAPSWLISHWGYLYGTTFAGGASNNGIVFKLKE